MKNAVLIIVLALAGVLTCSAKAFAFTMGWVEIGDAGNAGEQSRLESQGDTTFYGGVDYEYCIGKYEVTNNQYCEFLNAVDPNGSNPHYLYYPDMGDSFYGGISFRSWRPDRSKYSVKTGRGNNPVNFVSVLDIYRFANWMHNGQGDGSTETGAYDVAGFGYLASRSRGARVFLPNEDEWYKAAYYKGGGLDAGYSDYATASDTYPVSEAPPGGGNSANYWAPSRYAVDGHHLSDVGAYVNSPSAYGTFDQNGNVQEWTDTNTGHAYIFVFRGGAYHSEAIRLAASYRVADGYSGVRSHKGFRLASIPEPKVYYVDSDAAAGGDGESWAAAFNHLQDALSAARRNRIPHEIRVAEGTYKPDLGTDIAPGDRTVSFELIRGTNIKGGYAGLNQPDPNARDFDKYKTILSGDLNGDDVVVDDPCDLWDEPSRAENSYHVVIAEGTDKDFPAILDGFIVTCGNANGVWEQGNGYGGGIFCYAGNPTIINCVIRNNSVGYLGHGAGMSTEWGDPTLINCTFTYNIAERYGGGMLNYSGAATLIDCTFLRNSTRSGGGGMFNWNATADLTNCTFTQNSTTNDSGGAILNDGSDVTLRGCLIAGNSGIRNGGGIYVYDGKTELNNCTVIGNRANKGAGIYNYQGNVEMTQCIVWANVDSQIDGPAVVAFSDIEGGAAGQANLESDPCFADPGYWDDNGTLGDANDDFWVDGDCHLKSQAGRREATTQAWVLDDVTSPCIDAGDPMNPIGSEPFPNGGIINMGAYGGTAEASKSYFGKPLCEIILAGDINGDCEINFLDFRLMALHWLTDQGP